MAMIHAVVGLYLAWAPLGGLAVADAPTPIELKLWPGKPPGEQGTLHGPESVQRTEKGGKTVLSLTNVSDPMLYVFPAPKSTATGTAAVIFPGGGYEHLDWTEEGQEVAAWLNSIGITAAVLKYRVGCREGASFDYAPPMALMDAQRAMSLVRSRAKDWGVDPTRVGVVGFSAGGHLSAWVSTSAASRAYAAVDGQDRESCAADFAVLLYPYGIIKFSSKRYDANLKVGEGTPPSFLVVASDDDFCVDNALAYYQKLLKNGIPVELHAYESGGHSFAFRRTGKPSATWPARCEEWMRSRGLLKIGRDR